MSRRTLVIMLVLALMLPFVGPALRAAGAETADGTVEITTLIDNMAKYDGQRVTIQGEAIGDVLLRGSNAWITVNDDRYSKQSIEEGGELVGMSNAGIGVWIPAEETRAIKTLGSYKNKGDIVRVTGVFHRADKQHGGDTDIDAVSLLLIQKGYPFDHSFDWSELLWLLVLAGAAGGLWEWRRRRQAAGLKEAHKGT